MVAHGVAHGMTPRVLFPPLGWQWWHTVETHGMALRVPSIATAVVSHDGITGNGIKGSICGDGNDGTWWWNMG